MHGVLLHASQPVVLVSQDNFTMAAERYLADSYSPQQPALFTSHGNCR